MELSAEISRLPCVCARAPAHKYTCVSCLLVFSLTFVFFQGSALVGTEEDEVGGVEEEVEEGLGIEVEEDSEEEEVRLEIIELNISFYLSICQCLDDPIKQKKNILDASLIYFLILYFIISVLSSFVVGIN